MERTISYAIIPLALLFGCKDDPCLKGSGDATSEIRLLNEETNIVELYDNLTVEIYIDSSNYIEVVGGENVVPFVETQNIDNYLALRNHNACYFLRGFDVSLRLKLHLKNIVKIVYFGTGDIIMHDTLKTYKLSFYSEVGIGSVILRLDVDFLDLQINSGAVDINVFGVARVAGFLNAGSSWILANNFLANDAFVTTTSAGDCVVNVRDTLAYKLGSVGNIQYLGNPVIQMKEHTGKGQVFPAAL